MKITSTAALLRCGAASALCAATLVSAQLYAQEAAGADAASEGEIIVTGSRIARSVLEASTPIQTIGEAEILQQGSQNISDVLNELPAVGIGTSRTNSNFATAGNGQSTVDLRNLGENRTLVLINGRRVVSGIGGSSAVDLNNIPTDLIERVEVLTGGASAVYGSEAMAGVVNFTLKKDFDGLRLRAQAGLTGQEDNPRQLISGTFGKNFADGAGNITISGQYDRDEGLRSRNRKISAEDQPFRSGYPNQGRFFVDDPNASEDSDLSTQFTYAPDGTLKEGFDTAVDGFNRNGERYIAVPVERYLGNILAHYDFSKSFGIFLEGSYAKVKSRSRIEPLATDNSDAVLPDGTISSGLSLDNPFIPSQIRDTMAALGATTLPFFRRMGGVFDRSNRNDREYYRVVAGFKGNIADRWDWDLYYNYGRTKESTASETALRDRYFYALDAVAGPGGTVICRDAAARAAGCAPFNPFGLGAVSQASIDYITNNGQLSTYESKITQKVIGANIGGTLFTLPAGDVKIAAGVERRIEKSAEVYDLETQLGNTLSNALTNTSGKYKVFEAYAETIVPLITEKPFMEYFGLEGAVRVGDYSTVGSVFSWKAGATWAPVKDLRFRGVYSVATRAPNIDELYEGPAQDFPTGLTDPCEDVTATSTRSQDAYCRTLPGIAAQIAQAGIFQYNDNIDRQSIEGVDSGNPALTEETAKTLTLGVVYTPSFLRNFSVTVDFFDIRIKDAVQDIPRQVSIDECVASAGSSPLCSLIVREDVTSPRPRTPGTIFSVDAIPVNAASIKTRGIDVAINYNSRLDKIGLPGSISMALAYTYLDKLTLQPLAGLPVENNRGQLDGDGRLGAGFKHRANLSTTYTTGPVSFNWRVNYLSSIKDTLDPESALLSPEDNSIDDFFYHDIRLGVEIGEKRNMELYFGVDNLFDKKPPLINQNGASNITGTETAADTYDPFGRAFYAGVTVKF